MDLDRSIPKIEWPGKDGIHKVVQFLVDENPYLRFGQFGQDNHIDIVKRFANEIGVQIRVDSSFDYPLYFLPDEERYKIAGMGRCELTPIDGRRRAEFYGVSTDYYHESPDIGAINEEHLELMKLFSQNVEITYNPRRFI